MKNGASFNKIGFFSDVHDDRAKALPHIVADLIGVRKVDALVCNGDMKRCHMSGKLFGGLPMFCALVDVIESERDEIIRATPKNWVFTKSGARVINIGNLIAYVGHRFSLNFSRDTEDNFNTALAELRRINDGLRLVSCGHTHRQTYLAGQLVTYMNPGAVEDNIGWGYEYAIVDVEKQEYTFTRILPTPDDRPTFCVAIISDTLDISHRDATYWKSLELELKKRNVSEIIICGNIDLADIGRPELESFTVHFGIHADQEYKYRTLYKEKGKIPANWHVLCDDQVKLDKAEGDFIDINGFGFFIKFDLGLEYLEISEKDMNIRGMKIKKNHPGTNFIIGGSTRQAMYVEGQQASILNPGNVNTDRTFITLELPGHEITIGHIPYPPLPPIN